MQTIGKGSRVSLSSVDRRRKSHQLLGDSRLVDVSGDTADFALPIFREWYGAMALLEGVVAIDDLPGQYDRWLIPVSIAVSLGDQEQRQCLLTRIVRTDPGLAVLVLKQLTDDSYYLQADITDIGSDTEAGDRILGAMESWKAGLGELFAAIGPVDHEGNVTTLGVRCEGALVTTSWYQGKKNDCASGCVADVRGIGPVQARISERVEQDGFQFRNLGMDADQGYANRFLGGCAGM